MRRRRRSRHDHTDAGASCHADPAPGDSALEQRLRDVIAQFRAEELTTEVPEAEDVLVILSAVPLRASRPI